MKSVMESAGVHVVVSEVARLICSAFSKALLRASPTVLACVRFA
jgi:hypothetical protein